MATQLKKSNTAKNTWKLQKRTGGNRRKLLREYHNLLSYTVSVEDPQLTQENVIVSNSSSISSQAGVLCENVDLGSVHNISENVFESGATNKSDHKEVLCEILDRGCAISANFIDVEESSDSEHESNDYSKNFKFREKLKVWAIKQNISQMAMKDLLSILNERFSNILPNDPRTLLKTPRNILIKTLENNGEYWHNGISVPLKNILENIDNLPDIIHLNFNFDGLPIHNSSKKEFWPILANIHQVDADPFVIGVYFGIGKPKNLKEYLEEFVTETKYILQKGLEIKNKNISVKIRCFICDSPARAFIKEKPPTPILETEVPPEPESTPEVKEERPEVEPEATVLPVTDEKTEELKKDEDEVSNDSLPLKQMIRSEALRTIRDDTHTETDDDTPMELSREEEKDGKKRRDYSRKKKPDSRTCSGSESATEASAPESPSTSEATRHHRLWKKSVMLVYTRLCAHKYASLFLRPITDDEAPGYSAVVKRPMDLSTIRRNIENGIVRTTAEFQRDVLLMLSNALMYNHSEHSVYAMAKEMHEEATCQLGMLLAAQAHAGLVEVPPSRRKRRHQDSPRVYTKRQH